MSEKIITLKQSPHEADCWVLDIPDYHGAQCQMKFFGLDAQQQGENRIQEVLQELNHGRQPTLEPKQPAGNV